MKKLAALLLLHCQVLLSQRNHHHVSSQFRRSPQAMLSKPEDYLTDLSLLPRRPARYQQLQHPSIDMFLARGISKMTLDINKIIPVASPDLEKADNIVYGPITIAAAMALLLLGSLGQTFKEITNFWSYSTGINIHDNIPTFHEDFGRFLTRLEGSSGYDTGHTVNFATGIFIQRGYAIRPEYEQASKALYKTNVLSIDFQGNPQSAQRIINSWVSERTNGKIPLLLTDPPPSHTKAIIASVLYFKAPWQNPFFDGHTKTRPFYTNGRKNPSHKMAQMMVNGGEFPYYKDTNLGVEIMGFPYKGGRTTMYVILPMDSNAEKLKRLENTITSADIDRLVASTKIVEAVVLFPKMRLENTLDLTGTLQRLGVNALFQPYTANLGLLTSGIIRKEPESSYTGSFASRLNPGPILPPKIEEEDDDRLIFTRFGDHSNCAMKNDPTNNTTRCNHSQTPSNGSPLQSLEYLRQMLNGNPDSSNPELYADEVIHKVFIDITESGTEAAAATGVSLNRSGGRITFRVDMPFLFFIYHEETKIVLFFGSVKTPTPSETTS